MNMSDLLCVDRPYNASKEATSYDRTTSTLENLHKISKFLFCKCNVVLVSLNF